MSPQHIFFDLDGTLTDPREGITGSIQYALDKVGAQVPEKSQLEWCIGPPLRQSFVEMIGEVSADAAMQHYRDRFDELGWSENVPYAGIHDALQALTDLGVNLHVASSKPRLFVERILHHFDLAIFFDGVYGSNLDGTLGDKKDLLAHALATQSVEADVTIMLGDRKFDVIGARHNNMLPVGVLWGYGSEDELQTAGAHRLLKEVDEIVTVVTG